MTKRTRTYLFLFFVILFLIITPWAVFYAAGYKVNLSWPFKFSQALQKTGMFVIETEPEGAKIYLDDKLQESFLKKYFSKQESFIKTPAKIQGLRPGDYNVRIELDGYWPWQKKLTIHSGQSTNIEDLSLFKKNLPLIIEKTDSSEIKLSPNRNYLISISNKETDIINLKTEEILTINATTTPNKITWSDDEKNIIINKQIVNLLTKKITNLEQIIGTNINKIKWIPNTTNKISYQQDNNLLEFDLQKEKTETLWSGENFIDYKIKNDNLIFVSQYNQKAKLKNVLLTNEQLLQEIDLPCSPYYELLDQENSFLHLYDATYDILYLIDLNDYTNPLKETINKAKRINWFNENELVYANNFEIWLLNIEKNIRQLLTRISHPITNVYWHKDGKHIIYSNKKNVSIIEVGEGEEKKNSIKLINVEKINSSDIDTENNILYFSGKIGNQEGIYKLEI